MPLGHMNHFDIIDVFYQILKEVFVLRWIILHQIKKMITIFSTFLHKDRIQTQVRRTSTQVKVCYNRLNIHRRVLRHPSLKLNLPRFQRLTKVAVFGQNQHQSGRGKIAPLLLPVALNVLRVSLKEGHSGLHF